MQCCIIIILFLLCLWQLVEIVARKRTEEVLRSYIIYKDYKKKGIITADEDQAIKDGSKSTEEVLEDKLNH